MNFIELNKKIVIMLFFAMFIFLNSKITYAATYYMPDDFANLQAAMSGMTSGDELIIRDGTYTGEKNIIDAWHLPPNGLVNNHTIFRAEHPGSVVFDGEDANTMFYGNDIEYITFQGIIWGNTPGNCIYLVRANHIKLQKCGVYNSGGQNSGIAFHTCSYILVEDTYVWGHFFYGINPYHSDHIVLRRMVIRIDRGEGPWLAAFSIYGSSDVEVQDCIAIDADQAQYYDGPGDVYGFYNPNNGDGTDRANYRGCISLNIQAPPNGNDEAGYSGVISEDCHDFVFENCIFYNNGRGLWDRSRSSDFNHCNFGKKDSEYGWASIVRPKDVNNSIIITSKVAGIESGTGISDYNCFYGNVANYKSTPIGTHDYCSENSNAIDPIDGNPGNGIPALKYLVRIEDGSNLDGTASDGGDRGATIIKRMGKSGTFWGEPGCNLLQDGTNGQADENLWPFPNEDIIRQHMRAYSYDNGNLSGARGFCTGTSMGGSPQTLTKYIWEYLGNPIPPEIYGSQQQNTPPVANAEADPTVTDSDNNGSEEVTLDGSASYDQDGSITSYVWSEN
ncbi:MAG: hypothetical protein J7K84_00755, partial [Deltaproteobacteria bacterium]|nr:hypothetical protein [Deltaproteobacteria bacterium]